MVEGKVLTLRDLLIIVLAVVALLFTIVNIVILADGSLDVQVLLGPAYVNRLNTAEFLGIAAPVLLIVLALGRKKKNIVLFVFSIAAFLARHFVFYGSIGFSAMAIYLGSAAIFIALYCVRSDMSKAAFIAAAVLAVLALAMCAVGVCPFGYDAWGTVHLISAFLCCAFFWFAAAFAVGKAGKAEPAEKQNPSSTPKSTSTAFSPQRNASADNVAATGISAEELLQLKALLDMGVLSQAEYDVQKDRFLGLH